MTDTTCRTCSAPIREAPGWARGWAHRLATQRMSLAADWRHDAEPAPAKPTRDPVQWVRDGTRVVAETHPGDRHAVGKVIAYVDQPTVLIETDSGTRVSWVAAMCRPADPTVAEEAPRPAEQTAELQAHLDLTRRATREASRRSDITRTLATHWKHSPFDDPACRAAVRAAWPSLAAQLDALVGEYTVDPL